MDIEKLIEEAKAYREKSASDQGVVVLFNGDVAGWMNELRNSELWAPGAIAIDAESRVFIAEGGNNYDGSYRWIEQPPPTTSHVSPVSTIPMTSTKN